MTDITQYVIGGSFEHKSKALANKRAVNFWPQIIEDANAKSPFIAESFPGSTSFASQSGTNRGFFSHNGVAYHVVDTSLYSVSSAGAHTLLGSSGQIAGSSRVVFDGVGDSVLLAADDVAYEWDGSTLTTATDSDFETPQTVTTLNQRAIYDGDEGRFVQSNVGAYLTLNSSNYGTAEEEGDSLLRPYNFKGAVKMFGAKTIETHWDQGFGNPTLHKVQGATHAIGLAAIHSVAENDKYLYFLGDDHRVYRIQGNSDQAVSTQAIDREIEGFATISDAVGWCMTYQGRKFYVLTFPTADKTFCYAEDFTSKGTAYPGYWFYLQTGTVPGKWDAEGYAFVYRKHLVATSDGTILQLDDATYTENGATIQRTLDSSPIHSGVIGQPRLTLEWDKVTVVMQTAVGIASGQGSAPRLIFTYSDDGGKTFATERWADIGKAGDDLIDISFTGLGSSRSRILRFRITDPVYCSIHRVDADLSLGI